MDNEKKEKVTQQEENPLVELIEEFNGYKRTKDSLFSEKLPDEDGGSFVDSKLQFMKANGGLFKNIIKNAPKKETKTNEGNAMERKPKQASPTGGLQITQDPKVISAPQLKFANLIKAFNSYNEIKEKHFAEPLEGEGPAEFVERKLKFQKTQIPLMNLITQEGGKYGK